MSSDDINIGKLAYMMHILGRKDLQRSMTLQLMMASQAIADSDYKSETTYAQAEVEEEISGIYLELESEGSGTESALRLAVAVHRRYAQKNLCKPLAHYFKALDANHGWMLYWLLNFERLLPAGDTTLDVARIKTMASAQLGACIYNDGLGGIGGGPHQLGHVASTYASVLALALIEDYDTLARIRGNVYRWIMTDLRNGDGSFAMYRDGETDTRSTYCALVVASLLNIVTDEMVEGTVKWISRCQTYEGGFAGVPHTEAHGGYTFCAVASFMLLLGTDGDKLHEFVDTDALIRWLAMRQFQREGGLSGRTNKLVDACYSFWIGGVYAMLEAIVGLPFFNKDALRTYILGCCQDPRGGLRDKPGKLPDFYHLNYTMLGLCITESTFSLKSAHLPWAFQIKSRPRSMSTGLPGINPVFGLPMGVAERCKQHFVEIDTK